jgi:hypothetical protein
MKIKIKFLVVASSIMVIGLCGIGYAGSEAPLAFKYDLRFSEWTYSSHSVTFGHSTHAMKHKITCIRCHHTLEAGSIAVEETCRDCHTNTEMRSFPKAENIPEEKRMDYYFLAIHDQCINCHKEVRESDEWTKAPVGCWRCHVFKKK